MKTTQYNKQLHISQRKPLGNWPQKETTWKLTPKGNHLEIDPKRKPLGNWPQKETNGNWPQKETTWKLTPKGNQWKLTPKGNHLEIDPKSCLRQFIIGKPSISYQAFLLWSPVKTKVVSLSQVTLCKHSSRLDTQQYFNCCAKLLYIENWLVTNSDIEETSWYFKNIVLPPLVQNIQ